MVIEQDFTRMSQNDDKIKMADVNAEYFKINLIAFKIDLQEKESIMSVRY